MITLPSLCIFKFGLLIATVCQNYCDWLLTGSLSKIMRKKIICENSNPQNRLKVNRFTDLTGAACRKYCRVFDWCESDQSNILHFNDSTIKSSNSSGVLTELTFPRLNINSTRKSLAICLCLPGHIQGTIPCQRFYENRYTIRFLY